MGYIFGAYFILGLITAIYMEIAWPSKGFDIVGRFPVAVVFWPAAAIAMWKDRDHEA